MKPLNHHWWVIFVGLAGIVNAGPVYSGSLAPDLILASLSKVDLSVWTGDLGFEPILGLDLVALKEKMEAHCLGALAQSGLEVSGQEQATLIVTISHAWRGRDREEVAILVDVTLEVPATPSYGTEREKLSRARSTPLWDWESLELVSSPAAAQTILNALDDALSNLLESRQGALARSTRE